MLFVVVKKQVWVRYKKEMSCRKRSVSKIAFFGFFFKMTSDYKVDKITLKPRNKKSKVEFQKERE